MNNNFDTSTSGECCLSKAQDYIKERKELLKKQASAIVEEIDDLDTELKNLLSVKESSISSKDINIHLFSPCNSRSEHEKNLEEELGIIKLKIPLLVARKEEILKELDKIYNVENVFISIANNERNEKISDGTKENHILEKSLDQMGKCIIEAQELERNRIARDLHDTTVQVLTSLIHKTDLCTKLLDIDIIRTRLELVTMMDVLHNVINDMRTIIYDLRPMSLNDLGLVTTVERFLSEIKQKNHIQTSLLVNNEERDLPYVISITLYRVIQEACNNTIKHANANAIKVELSFLENSLELVISDDGKGFDYLSKVEDCNCKCINFGLSIIKERINLLSGIIDIQSKINQGTKIFVSVPIIEGDKEV